MISLMVNGNKTIHTSDHLKKVKDKGGISNTVIIFPTMKLQDQNKLARTNIK